jgi:hypothetical protein
MIRAAGLAPHRKFAIRSTFVRRTIVEQMAAKSRCRPPLRAVYAIAQIHSVFLAGVQREATPRAKPRLIST